jgi:SAM-dependent methyltransferase
MLRAAPVIHNVAYTRARAERLPFAPASFDVVTVASAVHWFEQSSFFADVHRVLRHRGWLVLYDHYFMGSIRDDVESEAWGHEFMTRFPLPPRNRSTGEKAMVPPELFDTIAEEFFDNDQQMTHEMLVDYAVTQSNSIAATERGEPVRAWVAETTAPFFSNAERRTVRFLSAVSCFRARSGT